MIKIRRNCFETNSSSMHSLVVSKQIKPYTKRELALGYDDWYKEKDRDFDLWEWFDDSAMIYERSPFQVLRTPLDKLRYYTAYTLGNYKKPKKSDIKRIEDFIMKQTGITDRKKICLYKEDQEWCKPKKLRKNKTYGAVYSNDSGEDPMHYVETHNISMEDLILNPKYTIIVDGDESQLFKSLFEAGIIDAENLEDISSGAEFWNDSNTNYYINWMNNEDNLEEFIDDNIQSYTKTLTFRYEITDRKENNNCDPNSNIEDIKKIIKLAKEKNSNIKIIFCAYTYLNDRISINDLKDYDLSIYDEIKVENHDDEEWK